MYWLRTEMHGSRSRMTCNNLMEILSQASLNRNRISCRPTDYCAMPVPLSNGRKSFVIVCNTEFDPVRAVLRGRPFFALNDSIAERGGHGGPPVQDLKNAVHH